MPDISDGFIQAVVVSDQLPTTGQTSVLIDPALSEKLAAAEAKLTFNAESDTSFGSCNHLSDAF